MVGNKKLTLAILKSKTGLHKMVNKTKLQVWLPILLSLCMIAGIFIGFNIRNGLPGKNFFYTEKPSTYQEVMELIKNKYVDDVDLKKISDTAIQTLLSKLDPHSVYIPAEELEDINDDIQGSFYGVGIEFDVIDDTLNVINVLKEGPALKAGLEFGDKIIAANGRAIAGKKMPSDSMRKILRGNRGSNLNIIVFRSGKTINKIVERNLIPVNSIDAAYMINNESGYIKINKFSTQTHREFMIALEELKKKGLKKLILDLRDNGGGVLDEAVEIADEFLDGDKLITYTEGKHMPRKEYRCKRQGQFEKGALTVLCNEGSASASEVLMGALQDWDRATIIGRRSFGKGLVQEQYDLSDNSALRLTVARYYSPSGRCIQRSYANGEHAYYEEIQDRLTDNKTENIADTSKYFTTSAGKKVYGGGGITPDVMMPADTIFYNANDVVYSVFNDGKINRFAYLFATQNNHLKAEYKTAENFVSNFNISDKMWNDFANTFSKDTIDVLKLKMSEVIKIKENIKASIARMYWDKDGFFKVINTFDQDISKSLEILTRAK